MRPSLRPERLDAAPDDLARASRGGRDRPADSRRCRAGRTSRSSTEAGIGAPWSCSIDREQRVQARARGRRDALPLERGSARRRRGSTGSTSRRSFASERRLSARSTSASHHSRDAAAREELALERRGPAAASRSSAARDRRRRRGRTAPRRLGAERAVRARVARDEIAERIGDGLEERRRAGPAAGRRRARRAAAPRPRPRRSGASPAIVHRDRRAARATSCVEPARPRASGRPPRGARSPPRVRSPSESRRSCSAVGVSRRDGRRAAGACARARRSRSASSSSRSSASPSSSRSCAWSTVSACARRSASGASPS